jgi:hypothetical protein
MHVFMNVKFMGNLSTIGVELSTSLAVPLKEDSPVTRGCVGFTIKTIPFWVWTGHLGYKRLRISEFLDKRLMVVAWQSQPYSPAAFTPQKISLVLISVRG